MKKILSLALALVMCLGLAVPAFAAEDDLIIEDGILVEYIGTGGDVVIPDGVTGIGMAAFMDCADLTSVTIPSSVTSIGNGAFHGCASLTSVTIPDGITDISYETFRSCTGLNSVTLPSSMTIVRVGAFRNCDSLKDVYYGGGEAQWKSVTIDDENEALKSAAIHYNGGTDAPAGPEQPAPAAAMPTNDILTADGVEQSATVYKINGSNYFKIRDLAAVLNGTEKQFEVGYDNATKSVTATTGKGYDKGPNDLAGAASSNETATLSNDTIYVDGVKIQAEVYKIAGSNYFKLRDLGKALDFYVGYEKGKGMSIDTTKPYSE